MKNKVFDKQKKKSKAWSSRGAASPSPSPFHGEHYLTCHGLYPVPVEGKYEASRETGQEGRNKLQGLTGQGEEGPSAEKSEVSPRVCQNHHPQE